MNRETIWQIRFNKKALKEFDKLDSKIQKRIKVFLDKYVLKTVNPRLSGKPLKGNLKELWRYRVGDYRVICFIDNEKKVIRLLHIGHRKDIYEWDISALMIESYH